MTLDIKTALIPFDQQSMLTESSQSSSEESPNKDQRIECLTSQVNTLNQLLELSEKSSLIQLKYLEKIIANQQKIIHQIQAEKRASLGQIVAGVSHEINNPINFISANLFHLKNYTQDLLKVLQLYQDYYPEPPEEIQTEITALDLDFVKEDTHKILKSMQQGSERISKIVKSLQHFVRSDEAEVKWVNIHTGIDSAIHLLQNRINSHTNFGEIEIIKNYQDLPEIECYPKEINQVFMNIISNAIDAFTELNPGSEDSQIQKSTACIKIQTEMKSENWISICISDNGCGMSEEVRAKIFDPFFTTKPVGAGTGLGLSTSYQIIVEKHHGKFSCDSTLGEGTKFVIEIPIQQ